MAQFKRGVFPISGLNAGLVYFTGAVVGPGAASAPTLPATTVVAAKDNIVASAARTSTGLYVLTLKELPTNVLDIIAQSHNTAGSTLIAAVRTWDTTAKTVTIDIRDGASSLAVAEAATTDLIYIHVICRTSNA